MKKADRRLYAVFEQIHTLMEPLRRSRLRNVFLLIVDAILAVAALWIALGLRFEGTVPRDLTAAFWGVAGVLASARVLATLAFRTHRWSFRFASLIDGARLGAAALAGTALFVGGCYFTGIKMMPRSVVVMELFMTMWGMSVVRFAPRFAVATMRDWARSQSDGTVRTLILGAGAAGEMLLRDLQRSEAHNYQVVGFLDDDAGKRGEIISGKAVVGTIADLSKVVASYRVEQVLIAIPRLEAKRIREILSMCESAKVRFKILPVSFIYLNERVSASMLQDLQPEDLLPRDPIEFSDSGERCSVVGRRVLVTGAAGSIGGEMCRQLVRAGVGRLVMVDMNENDLYLAKRRFEREHPGVDVVCAIGDIRDAGRMQALIEANRPQDVFHAAAHKHVPLMEAAPCEAVKNNILGTANLVNAARAGGVERFVYISTDKAVRPTSVMGASKRVGELIVRAAARDSAAVAAAYAAAGTGAAREIAAGHGGAEHPWAGLVGAGQIADGRIATGQVGASQNSARRGAKGQAGGSPDAAADDAARQSATPPSGATQFKAVRFGNVLGSSGSVVPIFKQQIEAGGPVTVTDPEVKRYFMTISEAVGLVLRAGYGVAGELCVLDMGEQIRIADLARHMVTMSGHVPDVDIAIEFIGLRPGEKLYEELLTEEEEQTHRTMKKIFTATCPAPPEDLDRQLGLLAAAAERGDAAGVIALFQMLVPSYTPSSNGHGRAATAAPDTGCGLAHAARPGADTSASLLAAGVEPGSNELVIGFADPVR